MDKECSLCDEKATRVVKLEDVDGTVLDEVYLCDEHCNLPITVDIDTFLW